MATIRPTAADVASVLRGIDFPASKEDLVTYARRKRDQAQGVLELLQQLPERQYNRMADVEKAVGEIIQTRQRRRPR